MYNLFLDDKFEPKHKRNYSGDGSIYDTENFVIAKSFDEFYLTIKKLGIPKFVSFDYDILGDQNGLDCAKFLKFECKELDVAIPMYKVHSSWPGIQIEFEKILK